MNQFADHLMMNIGAAVILTGGLALTAAIAGLMVWLAAQAWIAASNRWRDVLRGESLIYEYRQNRDEFLRWKEEQDG